MYTLILNNNIKRKIESNMISKQKNQLMFVGFLLLQTSFGYASTDYQSVQDLTQEDKEWIANNIGPAAIELLGEIALDHYTRDSTKPAPHLFLKAIKDFDYDNKNTLLDLSAGRNDDLGCLITQYLCQSKFININKRNKKYGSPFVAAVQNDCHDNIRILVEYGAKLDFKDKNGKTALDWANYHNQRETVKLLKSLGAKK